MHLDLGYLVGGISIHALREEGDVLGFQVSHFTVIFLSTPSARRATSPTLLPRGFGLFLSTPSARRATCAGALLARRWPDFYPRPPRGGRPASTRQGSRVFLISIHALREEGDMGAITEAEYNVIFLSTPSARRATGRCTAV